MTMNRSEAEFEVDGVKRRVPNGIKVIVAGGGVGGAFAALEHWRNGCDVVLLERSDMVSALGDYFTIGPSALVTLKEYPSMFHDYHNKIPIYDCTINAYHPNGECLFSAEPEWKRPGVPNVAPGVDVSFLTRRTVFTQMLIDQVIRLGIPVHWADKAVSVDENEDKVAVTTASGKTFEGDLFIVAGGIDISVKGADTGAQVQIQDSGYAMARVCFHRSAFQKGSAADRLVDTPSGRPEFRCYLANDCNIILFLTPHWVAWGFTHRIEPTQTAEESWHNLQDASSFLPQLEAAAEFWDPAVLDFVRQTSEKVVDWRLKWRDGDDRWTTKGGRAVKLGDAAHSIFPTAGNGGVLAMEDSITLAECIRRGGKDNISWSTKVFTKLRFERASIIQQSGVLNREELNTADHAHIAADPENNGNVGFFRLGRWIWAHDPLKYARENYEACLAHLKEGEPFQNTNLPPGHKYEFWTLESENKRIAAGVRSKLKQNGDWSF